MTTLLEIKPYIHDFIEGNLDAVFEDKVYWIAERRNIPEYPYCLLNVIAENKDKRTSHHNSRLTDFGTRDCITTRYKTCTITVGIYNGWTDDTTETDVDMDEAKEFAYEQIDYLEYCFENYPINKKFSVQNISPIRPLHETANGGYLYRYEFDLTIGYNEERTKDKEIGKSVDTDIKVGSEDAINFTVTIESNDSIEIETI